MRSAPTSNTTDAYTWWLPQSSAHFLLLPLALWLHCATLFSVWKPTPCHTPHININYMANGSRAQTWCLFTATPSYPINSEPPWWRLPVPAQGSVSHGGSFDRRASLRPRWMMELNTRLSRFTVNRSLASRCSTVAMIPRGWKRVGSLEHKKEFLPFILTACQYKKRSHSVFIWKTCEAPPWRAFRFVITAPLSLPRGSDSTDLESSVSSRIKTLTCIFAHSVCTSSASGHSSTVWVR